MVTSFRPIVLSLLIFCLTGFSCLSPPRVLPPDMPADFKVTMTSSGGMLPVSDELVLQAKGGSFSKHTYGQGSDNSAQITFDVPSDDLQTLYKVYFDNNFDLITSHEEVIYDRGGLGISVAFGAKQVAVSDSGMTVIDQKWQENWNNIYAATQSLKDKMVAAHSVTVTFHLSKAVMALDDFGAEIDTDNIYYAGNPDTKDAGPDIVRELMPGNYALALHRNDGKSYLNQSLTIDGDEAISIDYKDGSFTVVRQ